MFIDNNLPPLRKSLNHHACGMCDVLHICVTLKGVKSHITEQARTNMSSMVCKRCGEEVFSGVHTNLVKVINVQ